MSAVRAQGEAAARMSNCESILKYTRYALLIAGAFDIQDGTNSSLLYKIWSFLSQGYYALFTISLIVGLKDVLMGDSNDPTFSLNVSAVLMANLMMMKVVLSYTRGIRDRLKEVYQFENAITNDDLECTRIYNSNSRYNYQIMFASFSVYLATGLLFMWNNFNNWKHMNFEDSTQSKTLFYRGWFPFDLRNPTYFNVAYFFQFFVGIWTPWFMLSFDSIFISMLNFATARVGILGYKFENFEMYSNGRSESTFNCLRNIVLEHQKLIKYVENANESLKWYFFTEFLFKSYHITVSLLTVMRATNVKDVVFHIGFLSMIVGQVFVIYYHVNELSLESTDLSQRIFNSNWYDQSSEVKRSLLIVMARVQRPLVLTIGNFAVIDNDLIVTMVKAAYTFVMYHII